MPKCADCRFYSVRDAQCHAHPPVLKGFTQIWCFPFVPPDDWCGEFEPVPLNLNGATLQVAASAADTPRIIVGEIWRFDSGEVIVIEKLEGRAVHYSSTASRSYSLDRETMSDLLRKATRLVPERLASK